MNEDVIISDNIQKTNLSIHLNEINTSKHTCSIICPDVEFLKKIEIVTDVICPVPNCDEIFSQVSALNLHLEKVHRINQKVKFY